MQGGQILHSYNNFFSCSHLLHIDSAKIQTLPTDLGILLLCLFSQPSPLEQALLVVATASHNNQ